MSVRKARAIVWAYNAILFLLFVVLMTVLRPKYPIVAGIIFVLVYWFGPDYGQRTANKLLDNMWLQADKLGLSAADLGKVTKYQAVLTLNQPGQSTGRITCPCAKLNASTSCLTKLQSILHNNRGPRPYVRPA